MESCGSLKGSVSVGNSYAGLGRPSMAHVHNGDVGGHRERTSEACFPKQERREVENGIPRELSSCRAEDSSEDQSRSRSLSLSPPQENGFLPSREEQDAEKEKDDSLTPPRKKRGRRKLERPTKCEFLLASVCLVSLSFGSRKMSCGYNECKMLSHEL